jgi:group I intron endonuclease
LIGIYKIENKITGEIYIGQSKNIEARWQSHRRNATAKDKVRKYALYREIRRYGIDSFEFSVLEECPQFKLDERENYWIEYYSNKIHLYNIKMPKGAVRK